MLFFGLWAMMFMDHRVLPDGLKYFIAATTIEQSSRLRKTKLFSTHFQKSPAAGYLCSDGFKRLK